MKLILCDDDSQFLDYIKDFLTIHLESDTVIFTCTNYSGLQIILEEEQGCDLLFMDIRLSEGNGILFCRNILKQHPHLPVIFISGYADKYYQQAFLDVRPYGFIRKPVEHQLLLQLIQKFQQEKINLQPAYHYFRTIDGIEKLMFDNIYFLENNHHLVYIYTDKETFTVRTTFSEMLSILPNSFVLCHRGYIVNLQHVQKYEANHFIMADDIHTVIKISQSRASEVKKRFFKFLDTE